MQKDFTTIQFWNKLSKEIEQTLNNYGIRRSKDGREHPLKVEVYLAKIGFYPQETVYSGMMKAYKWTESEMNGFMEEGIRTGQVEILYFEEGEYEKEYYRIHD